MARRTRRSSSAKKGFIEDNNARRLAAKTITTRESILDLLIDSVSRHKALRDLTAHEVRAVYMAPSLESPAASQAFYFTVLRTFLRWCVEEELLDVSPLEGVKRPGVRTKVPDYFTPEQFKALLKHIHADLKRNEHKHTGRASLVLELPDLVRFAVLTGLRRTEQLSIRWMGVDLQRGLVHARSYVDKGCRITFNVKDGDGRIVPLAPEAKDILERRRAQRTHSDATEPVFCRLKGRRRDGARLSRTFKSYVRDAKDVPSHLYWHALRHTFASWLVSGGTPVAIVSDWLGHADISLTMNYYAALMPSALQWTGSTFHERALATPSGAAGMEEKREDNSAKAGEQQRMEAGLRPCAKTRINPSRSPQAGSLEGFS